MIHHSRSKFCTAAIATACLTILSACSGGGGGSSSDGTPNALGTTPVNAPSESGNRPSAPELSVTSSFNTFGQARAILEDDGFYFVADGSTGLVVLTATEGTQLQSLGNFPLNAGGKAYSIQKRGSTLYVTTRSEGLHVIDASNPLLPTLIQLINTPSEASYSTLVGDRLYVTASAHFLIYDVGDSANPREISRLASASPLQRVSVKGNRAYIAAYNDGLMILDISDETNPKVASSTSLLELAQTLVVDGNTVYVGGEQTLSAVNVAGGTPQVIASIELTDANGSPASIQDMQLEGDFLYVASGQSGVLVIDVSQPYYPLEVEALAEPPRNALGLLMMGRSLFVADGSSGVSVLDVFATTDTDGDNVLDGADAFPNDAQESADTDLDGVGNNADTDDDNDGVLDIDDDLPLDPTETIDSDSDGVGDLSDTFPTDSSESVDTDGDGIGNNADTDDDADGIPDSQDSEPLDALNVVRVTDNGGGNFFPKLDKNLVVWRGFNINSAPRVFLQNLDTGELQNLSEGLPGFTGIPSLSDGKVAWRMYNADDNTAQIWFWDGTDRSMITEYPAGNFGMPWGFPPSYHSIDVSLHNGLIAWAGWDGNDYEIYLWDGDSITQITDNEVQDFEPQMNNGQIAWTGEEGVDVAEGFWDIFFWDGSEITNVSNRPGRPDEDGHLMNGSIAWSGYNVNQTRRDIFLWDGSDTTIIALPGDDYEPQIDETTGFVAWHNVNSSIYSLQLWDGFGRNVLKQPSELINKSPFFNEGRVAWSGYDANGADIYIGFYQEDKDSDGALNGQDAFPLDPTESEDSDKDGVGNNADTDDDNDLVADSVDFFPLDPDESSDSDGDGFGDNEDVYPLNPAEWADADLDGIADNIDPTPELTASVLRSLDTNGEARGIVREGGFVYVADGSNGLRIYSLDSGPALTELSVYKTTATGDDFRARSLQKVGNILYVAYRGDGLHVLDVSNPSSPRLLAKRASLDRATFVTIFDDRLYLSDRGWLQIFDIGNPADPILLGSAESATEYHHLVVDQGIAYIAAYYSGLVILDVSDPENISQIAQTPTDGHAFWAIEKQDDLIYVAGEGSGLRIFNVENPETPSLITEFALPSQADPKPADQPPFTMQLVGQQLFIADGFSGLQIVDVSDPKAPFISAAVALPGYSWDFALDGYTVIVGAYRDGFHIINIGQSIDHDGDGIPNYIDPEPLVAN